MSNPDSALPDPAQRWLLEAALRDGDAAVGAWRQWVRAIEFDEMDAASQRLIPLLARNLERLDIDHPDRGRMRGIHRYWWSRNQILLHRLPQVLDVLRAERIDAMVLKGIPLALRYYDDIGLRPMADFDLLVRTEDADRAVGALHAGGWTINEPVRVFRRDRTVDVYARPGVGFVAGDDTQCDLHWHLLHDCCWDGADDTFWTHATTLEWRGHTFLVPSPTDLLLHVIVHGTAFNLMPPIRWIADTVQVLRTAPDEIDWDRMMALAERRWLTIVVREAFELVIRIAGIGPPADVMHRLRTTPVAWAEKLDYQRRLVDVDYRYTVVGRWCQLSRQYAELSPSRRLLRAPTFMQQIWAVESKARLPFTFAFRIVPSYLARVVRGSAAPTA